MYGVPGMQQFQRISGIRMTHTTQGQPDAVGMESDQGAAHICDKD